MTNSGVRRKLSAILSADVKGYSRLMAEDEAGTVETLKEYREVMAQYAGEHEGPVEIFVQPDKKSFLMLKLFKKNSYQQNSGPDAVGPGGSAGIGVGGASGGSSGGTGSAGAVGTGAPN